MVTLWRDSTPPVLLVTFNRPNLTRRVFERIREATPPQLFVAGDGPRSEVPGDRKRCTRTRHVATQVDWTCELHTLFRETNLGCKRAVSLAIDWFFEHVEAGIILEDDCVPDQSFFRFCARLLVRYREDQRIMAISGNNFQEGSDGRHCSYYFSRYPHCWGWATWDRAWRHYDGEMALWPSIRDGAWLNTVFSSPRAVRYWTRLFDRTYRGKIDSWAYPWTLSCWAQSGLTILPRVNLVSNIGFGADATHTARSHPAAGMPMRRMEFPLRHPLFVMRDAEADRFTQAEHFDRGTVYDHVAAKAKKLLKLWRLAP